MPEVGRAAPSAPGGLETRFPGEVLFPTDRSKFGRGGSEAGGVNRSENELFDCEVEGNLPLDLDGAFYRVGPDPQYPKPDRYASDIWFDGEGHVGVFRIRDGHVDYRTRFARTQRWKAQHAARRSLFGMYRNPFTDDPSVQGLSRGTANTQQFFHHGKLLVLKEDSPPVTMHPLTLETTDDYYTYGGKLQSLTHTAHPKIDPMTGELVAFGYEARGLGSDDVYVFSCDRGGHINWEAWIKVPYVSMIHDFAVTQKHIVFFVCPLAFNMPQIRAGKVHWAWDSTLPSYMGIMRRGGDGRDLRWFTGKQLMCTHVMGAWSEGETVYVDMDGGESNQFAFFPNLHEPFDPRKAAGYVRRFKVDFGSRRASTYEVRTLYPGISGALSRQDDRYHTLPYRYGFLNAFSAQGSGWAMFDHLKKRAQVFSMGPDVRLQEMCFVPRRPGAPEGDGYLIGIADHVKENGRSDLILVDTRHLVLGPVARVKMPYRVMGQVHGFWVSGDQLSQIQT